MSAWDGSFVDYTAPPDGRMTLAVGGLTGDLRLVNGQTISFPWKRQQETFGADVATINVDESSSGGVDYEAMLIRGPSLTASGTQAQISLIGWEDNTSAMVLSQEIGQGGITLTNDGVYADLQFIAENGAVINTGTLDVNGGMSVDGGVLDVNAGMTVDGGVTDINGGIDATGGSAIITSSGAKVAITSPDNYDVEIQGGDDIQLFADIDVRIYATTGDITIWPFAGDLLLLGDTIQVNGVNIKPSVEAWPSYTPTLTQFGTVTKTVTFSKYWKYGRTVVFETYLVATGSGTASNAISVSLPFTASAAGVVVGSFYLYDSSAGVNRTCVAALNSTTTVSGVLDGSAGYIGASGFTDALTSGDAILLYATYEATS